MIQSENAGHEGEGRLFGYSGYNPHPSLSVNLADLKQESKKLHALFPELACSDYDHKYVERIRQGQIMLPSAMERWMLLPDPHKIALEHNASCHKGLLLLKKTYKEKFFNWRKERLGSQYLQKREHTIEMWNALRAAQKGHDILVVPVQFGLLYQDYSVHNVRKTFTPGEFGLGAFEVGVMLLLHPERFKQHNDLWVDCPGDEYTPTREAPFTHAPCFGIWKNELLFGVRGINYGGDCFGSATAAVPTGS